MAEKKKRIKRKCPKGYDFEFKSDEIAEALTEKLQEEGEDIPREEVDVEFVAGTARSILRVRGKAQNKSRDD